MAIATRTRTRMMTLFRLTTGPFACLRRQRRLAPQVYNSRASERAGFAEERWLWSGIAVLYRATSGGFGLSSGGGSTMGAGAGSSSGVSGVSSSSSSWPFGTRSGRSSDGMTSDVYSTATVCALGARLSVSVPSALPMFLPDRRLDVPLPPDREGCLPVSSHRRNRRLPRAHRDASSLLDRAAELNSTPARDFHAPLDRGAVPCNRDPSLTTVLYHPDDCPENEQDSRRIHANPRIARAACDRWRSSCSRVRSGLNWPGRIS